MIARRDMKVRLAARRELSPTCFAVELTTRERVAAEPGQFGMLSCGPGHDPFLRRPFSLAGVRRVGSRTCLEMVIKEVGRGTHAVRTAPTGTTLALLAPLGRGYELQAAAAGRSALVAGGIGLPPVLFAAERLAAAGAPFDLYMGAATARELLLVERCAEACAAVGGDLILATDDGSRGEHRRVTESLEERLAEGRVYVTTLACGPTPMLAALTVLARERGLDVQLSLEEPMACGVGVCLGCVVGTADGRRVASCKEGPVFRAHELAERWWE